MSEQEKQQKSFPAIVTQVSFGTNHSIDGYLLETGEIRYSKTGAGVLLRGESTWINGLEKKTPEQFKVLRRKGYTDWSQQVKVARVGKRGVTIAQTISGEDLDILISVEAERGNKTAAALLVSGWRQYRIDQSRKAFGLQERTEAERLTDFSSRFVQYLEDQADWDLINEQEEFLQIDQEALKLSDIYFPTAESYDLDNECYQPNLHN